MLADTAGVGSMYDEGAQACLPCPAGTARDETLKTCVAW